MNRFIEGLKKPWVEIANVALQTYIIYRFVNGAVGLFNSKEITSESSVIGQFFGTHTSILILAWAYTILAAALLLSLIWFWIKGTRRFNTVALIMCYGLVGYTLSFIALFNPDYVGRMLLVLLYSTIIVFAWLRNMLITRKPKIATTTDVQRILED